MIEPVKSKPLKPIKENKARVTYQCGPVFYISAKAGGVLADHKHSEAETLWIVEGRGRIQVGEEISEFEAPCIVEIPSGVYHKFMPETDVNFIEQLHEAEKN
jgi:mannose-6-phosphate isomerase-like protein (cupin superfamily)